MFDLGRVVMTNRINENLNISQISNLLTRYVSEDWGELGEEDKAMNDSAVKNNDDRILARYTLDDDKNNPIYIITEYDRSCTTILFADEY